MHANALLIVILLLVHQSKEFKLTDNIIINSILNTNSFQLETTGVAIQNFDFLTDFPNENPMIFSAPIKKRPTNTNLALTTTAILQSTNIDITDFPIENTFIFSAPI